MEVYTKDNIWNVSILGHSGVGKTTLIESILKITETKATKGTIEKGNTTSDYLKEEIKRQSSTNASLIPVEWKNKKINFLDTPGYYDYIGEMQQAVSVSGVALIVVSAKEGIEAGAERAYEEAVKLGIPKIIYVSNMDNKETKLQEILTDLKGKFGKNIAPVQVPFYENDEFVGFVNTIKRAGRRFVKGRTEECDVPEDISDSVEQIHSMLTEAVAETDDELMEKFFEDGDFSVDEMEDGIKKGILTGDVTPVFCGAAIDDIGTRVLLNSIIKFVPNMSNFRTETEALDENNEEITLKFHEDEVFSAFVFKTLSDPYVGKLSFFKVTSGIIKNGDSIFNSSADKAERVSNLFILRGKEQIPASELHCGDIGVISKAASLETGHTLCSENKIVKLNRFINFKESLTHVALIPVNKKDEDKLSDALFKITEEDKTIHFQYNKETKELVMRAMGTTHIELTKSKLKELYKIDVEIQDAKVPYKETLKRKITIESKYKKQSGGHGQYGHVKIDFEPLGDYSIGYVFEEKIFGGSVPKQYFPAVEKGLQDSIKEGFLEGYPIVGLKATLVDGSYHPVDSSEQAFKMATISAVKDAFDQGNGILLEPIYSVDVTVNNMDTGVIMGDLTKRGGRILGVDERGGKSTIHGEAPLGKLYKYAIDLRTMTKGRGNFTMTFNRYDAKID
ncbi:MAG: elongation factor G [Lachnospirales bacterium]